MRWCIECIGRFVFQFGHLVFVHQTFDADLLAAQFVIIQFQCCVRLSRCNIIGIDGGDRRRWQRFTTLWLLGQTEGNGSACRCGRRWSIAISRFKVQFEIFNRRTERAIFQAFRLRLIVIFCVGRPIVPGNGRRSIGYGF